MSKADVTSERLLEAARAAFWSRGYSNVSLREIAKDAGTDVALISRYFGGKLGLFKAALAGAFAWDELLGDDPVSVVVRKYSDPDKDAAQRSSVQMILMNATDPDVGALVRAEMERALLGPLRNRIGGPDASARLGLFVAAVLGTAMVRQNLGIAGVSDAPTAEYERQLRHMIEAALAYRSG